MHKHILTFIQLQDLKVIKKTFFFKKNSQQWKNGIFVALSVFIMLEITRIRENKEEVINGLIKKNFENAKDVVDEVLRKDTLRKETQMMLDETLASANQQAKKIGMLMKEGKKEEEYDSETKDSRQTRSSRVQGREKTSSN